MTDQWLPQDTTTHQDHVIAHVIGATVLGYFILDEAVYILLDIGFIWKIYIDGEMGLLPHPVIVRELEIEEELRAEITSDVETLLRDGLAAPGLKYMNQAPVNCLIEDVSFYANDDAKRILIKGEKGNMTIVTSIATQAIEVT